MLCRLAAAIFIAMISFNAQASMLEVQGGTYVPIIGKGEKKVVKDFLIDETAVTNEEFRDFVMRHPEWQRGRAPSLFVDSKYLSHWESAEMLGPNVIPHAPVTNVSWFAAKSFCESRQSVLPSVDQWEYLAQFGPHDDSQNVEAIILGWYSKPNQSRTPAIKSTFKNKYGVWDVHGLVWEWANDFNTTFVTGESRGDSALEKSMFCGAGAASTVNPSKYSAFMRFGFRTSLKANYSVENLGFRCSKGANS